MFKLRNCLSCTFALLTTCLLGQSVLVHADQERTFERNDAKPSSVSASRGIRRHQGKRPGRGGGSDQYRSYNGHNNNLQTPDMGMADTHLNRWTNVNYVDGMSVPMSDTLPSARAISNGIFDQAFSRPNSNNASDYLWQWGQFLDHDIDLTDGTDPPEPMPISVPPGDVYFDPDNTGTSTIPFNRSIHDTDSGSSVDNPRQQINEITSWIDASNVYGSNAARAAELRTNDGTGQLKTSAGNFLPFNVNGFPNAGGNGSNLFLAGDVRANEQVGLTAMHTLFVREHNRLAGMIASQDPHLSGEEIYQRARRLVGAMVQFITYSEFLPTLLGADALPPYQGYDSDKDASISNIFSTAAYRFGHSTLSPRLLRVTANGNAYADGHLDLRDAFFSPMVVTEPDSLEAILRGLSVQVCQAVDAFVIDDIRNFLFGPPGAGGLDLASLNIQRGRDHGLDRYNAVRTAMGLSPKAVMTDISSDSNVVQALGATYSHVEDIDVWVGGLAEDTMPGAMVGELFYTVIRKQFIALRDGDRFWYQNDLTAGELAIVESSTLAELIRRNTDIGLEISDTVFVVSNLPDSDSDGVEDIRDNCSLNDNALQEDTDNDGFGNRCDIDINNDGRGNFLDFAILAQNFLTPFPAGDFNSDGIVNNLDVVIFAELFMQPVGPSGLH